MAPQEERRPQPTMSLLREPWRSGHAFLGAALGIGGAWALMTLLTPIHATSTLLGLLALIGALGFLGRPVFPPRKVREADPSLEPEGEPPTPARDPVEKGTVIPAEPKSSTGSPTDEFPRDPISLPGPYGRLIRLPSGSFRMGASDGDDMAYPDETPHHSVQLSGFSMMEYPVTEGLYAEVLEKETSQGDSEMTSRPKAKVNWFDALEFCNRASLSLGLRACYEIENRNVRWVPDADGFRLPTEAEWEFACRAGTTTRFSFGDDPAQLGDHAWFRENSGNSRHAVDERSADGKPAIAPNPWGFHHLHGNVLEWCWDQYESYEEKISPNPVGPSGFEASGSGDRVLRGGSAWFEARNLRSSYRFRFDPEVRNENFGFRCVRGPLRQQGD